MKIIGRNSLSQYLAYLMFIMFAIFLFHLVYEYFAYFVLWYKYESGSKIFSNTFILAKDIGWGKNPWTAPIDNELKYRINYPFSETQVMSGLYPDLPMLIQNCIGLLWVTLFFFLSYKCFKEMSTDQIFNKNAVKWLKWFAYLNLIFSIIGLIEFFFSTHKDTVTLLSHIFIGLLGLMILFIVEFFKKGLELQNENDLTI